MLRPGVFSSNTLTWADGIRTEGVVRLPFARARIAPIDERDVAAVAVRALLSADGLLGAAPVLSGPEALTQTDQVRIVSRALGVGLRFEEIEPEAAREAMINSGLPPWAVDGLLRYYATAATRPVPLSSAVADITGEQPRTFADWANHHATAFGLGVRQ